MVINPSGAEAGKLWEDKVNTMAADDLAPCVSMNYYSLEELLPGVQNKPM